MKIARLRWFVGILVASAAPAIAAAAEPTDELRISVEKDPKTKHLGRIAGRANFFL